MTSNKKIIIVVGVVALIVVVYLWWKNRQNQTATGPATNTTTNPVTGQTTTNYTAASGNAQVPSMITDWFKTLATNNQSQAFKMLPNMTSSDINGLVDLLTNVWGKNSVPSDAQKAFWNTWRTTYHILDGTILN